MRHAGRTDANQREIVQALRAAGRSVLVLSNVGGGCPDLLVGWGGRCVCMEVKTATGELTPDQVRFRQSWRGGYLVVRSVAEALAATGVR